MSDRIAELSLRKRGLFKRLLFAPKLFVQHFRAIRPTDHPKWRTKFIVAWRFTRIYVNLPAAPRED